MKLATKTVGVIGGLGPAATLDFFAKVLRATNAVRDQDHLRLLIDNDPRIPDRNAALAGEGPTPGPALAAAARGLERAGADFIVLVCNAAHAYQREIEAAISVRFLSMIDETARTLAALEPRPRRVGVLAADACLGASLYQRALASLDVCPILLQGAEQRSFMTLLYRVKAGDVGAEVRGTLRALADALVEDGADAILAGCTEVPLLLDAIEVRVPLVSSTDVLALRTIAFARGEFT